MDREPRRRRRPALSCLECRRRKIKCDRLDPCSHCTATRSDCLYRRYHSNSPTGIPRLRRSTSPRDSPLGPSASTTTVSETVIHGRNVPLEKATEPPTTSTESPSAPVATLSSTPGSSGGGNETQPPDPNDLWDIGQSIPFLARQSGHTDELDSCDSVRGLSESNRDIVGRQAGLQNSQIMLKKTRVLGWSFWMATVKEVLNSKAQRRVFASFISIPFISLSLTVVTALHVGRFLQSIYRGQWQ